MDQLYKSKNQRATSLRQIFTHSHLRDQTSSAHALSAPPKVLQCQRGYLLITGLSLLPLLISAALATGAVIWFLNTKEKIEYLCENQILKIQDELLIAEEQILKLNPFVKALIIEKKILLTALLASPTPLEKMALLAKIKIVNQKMQRLQILQKQIWKRGEFKAQQKALILLHDLEKSAQQVRWQWSTSHLSQVKITPPHIQLQEIKVDPLLSEYQIPLRFEKIQTLKAHWLFAGASLFPSWIRLLMSKKIYWQENCSSHPQKENHKWQSQIGEGNPSLSF